MSYCVAVHNFLRFELKFYFFRFTIFIGICFNYYIDNKTMDLIKESFLKNLNLLFIVEFVVEHFIYVIVDFVIEHFINCVLFAFEEKYFTMYTL